MGEKLADEFQFSTGIKVSIRRVSPFLVNEIERTLPEPEPPTQRVRVSENEERIEKNFADPEYAQRLAKHHTHLGKKKMDFIVKRGVVLDAQAIAPDIERVRAEWWSEFQTELEETDPILAYVKYVCVGAGNDYYDLIAAITMRSTPTEEGIAAEAKSFPGDVSGT